MTIEPKLKESKNRGREPQGSTQRAPGQKKTEIRSKFQSIYQINTLSNNYLNGFIKCLELEIFNVKVKVLFVNIKKMNKTLNFTFNISSSRHFMTPFKYLFGRAKPRL